MNPLRARVREKFVGDSVVGGFDEAALLPQRGRPLDSARDGVVSLSNPRPRLQPRSPTNFFVAHLHI